MVVARLLAPRDYGIIGLATLYVGLVTLLADSGIGSSVVTLRSLKSRQISQLHVLSGLVGTLLFLLSCLLAWPIARFFETPQLPPIIMVMSSLMAIAGWQSVPDALLQKQFRFRFLALRDMLRGLAGAAGTIVLALLGFQYWALAIGPVIGGALALTLTLGFQRISLGWPRLAELREAIAFSAHTLSGRLVWYAYSNADFLVAGKVLSTASLGAYTLAWSLANVSVEKVSTLVGRVTPSFFSAAQSDPVMLRSYLGTLTQAIALAAFPVSVGIALVASDFVPAVLGPRWIPAVAPLIPLSLYAGLRSLTPILTIVLRVTGDQRFNLVVGLVTLAVMPVVFYVGSTWGTVGIAYGWVIGYPFLVIPLFARVFSRLSIGPMTYLGWLRPALTCTLLMAGVVSLMRLLLASAWPVPMRLALCVVAGAATYAGALFLFFRPTVRYLLGSIRGSASATPVVVD